MTPVILSHQPTYFLFLSGSGSHGSHVYLSVQQHGSSPQLGQRSPGCKPAMLHSLKVSSQAHRLHVAASSVDSVTPSFSSSQHSPHVVAHMPCCLHSLSAISAIHASLLKPLCRYIFYPLTVILGVPLEDVTAVSARVEQQS